jgi:poly(3-hydroxybutyrate) depolymerase
MTQMTVFLPLAVIITLAAAADRLGTYTIDKSKISISGISSGAFFAVQFHVAFSRDIMGVGVTAGGQYVLIDCWYCFDLPVCCTTCFISIGPYFCAKGNVTRAITVCMKYPLFINVTELVSITHAMEQNKTIDPVQEMQGDKVLLVSGLLDTVVRQGVMVKLLEWYKNFVDASNISTVFEIPAEHAMVCPIHCKILVGYRLSSSLEYTVD